MLRVARGSPRQAALNGWVRSRLAIESKMAAENRGRGQDVVYLDYTTCIRWQYSRPILTCRQSIRECLDWHVVENGAATGWRRQHRPADDLELPLRRIGHYAADGAQHGTYVEREAKFYLDKLVWSSAGQLFREAITAKRAAPWLAAGRRRAKAGYCTFNERKKWEKAVPEPEHLVTSKYVLFYLVRLSTSKLKAIATVYV